MGIGARGVTKTQNGGLFVPAPPHSRRALRAPPPPALRWDWPHAPSAPARAAALIRRAARAAGPPLIDRPPLPRLWCGRGLAGAAESPLVLRRAARSHWLRRAVVPPPWRRGRGACAELVAVARGDGGRGDDGGHGPATHHGHAAASAYSRRARRARAEAAHAVRGDAARPGLEPLVSRHAVRAQSGHAVRPHPAALRRAGEGRARPRRAEAGTRAAAGGPWGWVGADRAGSGRGLRGRRAEGRWLRGSSRAGR